MGTGLRNFPDSKKFGGARVAGPGGGRSQQTSLPAPPGGRMLSCVSCAECSLAFSLSAAMLEARRSAAADDDVEEEEEGSGSTAACPGPSVGGAGFRRSAAAVDALVRGPMEKSLQGRERAGVSVWHLSGQRLKPRELLGQVPGRYICLEKKVKICGQGISVVLHCAAFWNFLLCRYGGRWTG